MQASADYGCRRERALHPNPLRVERRVSEPVKGVATIVELRRAPSARAVGGFRKTDALRDPSGSMRLRVSASLGSARSPRIALPSRVATAPPSSSSSSSDARARSRRAPAGVPPESCRAAESRRPPESCRAAESRRPPESLREADSRRPSEFHHPSDSRHPSESARQRAGSRVGPRSISALPAIPPDPSDSPFNSNPLNRHHRSAGFFPFKPPASGPAITRSAGSFAFKPPVSRAISGSTALLPRMTRTASKTSPQRSHLYLCIARGRTLRCVGTACSR